jgi:undecaprenyl-diphosphatase
MPRDEGEGTVAANEVEPSKKTWIVEVRAQAVALDRALWEAVDQTETRTLDRLLVRLSEAANYSRLWLASAGAVARVGGPSGRRAAAQAVASPGLSSAVSNVALKSLARRRRPEAGHGQALPSRQVRRPTSPSFPSGHAASALVGAMCGWTVRRLAGRLAPRAGAGHVAAG